MSKKSSLQTAYILLAIAMLSGLAFAQVAHPAKTAAAGTPKGALVLKSQELQAKLDIVTTQWYDISARGVVLGAPEAGNLLKDARQAITAGDTDKASGLLGKAEVLLNAYSKQDLPPYAASTPLKDPADHGKVHKATIADLKAMEFFGVPRWNYWFNFVGTGDDGNKYMAYAYINHHGTGKLVPPVVFAMSSSADPSKIEKTQFLTVPTLRVEKDRLVYSVEEGGRSLTYSLADGKISIAYKDAGKTVEAAVTTKYSFWYNKGVDYALILPGSPMAGFEETGKAEATFVLGGKKIAAQGFGESENLFCGGPKGADYRTALIKYGNEWWVPFWTEQAEGLIIMTGDYKDAGFHIGGKYIIPSDFHVTPIVANQSFRIDAKTTAGDLSLTFTMWGWDPPLYEHWGTVEGTLAGKKLSHGYCWLEHIPQGGVNASPPVGGRKGTPPPM
jgi:hypothetical protein